MVVVLLAQDCDQKEKKTEKNIKIGKKFEIFSKNNIDDKIIH